ncbi:unnamed protein product [Penicillium olsonii]|nr:unnamed protein product [Penicillium olsonii]CAG7932959.1 unnamed protein product [Penicillium olsonii]
MEPSQGLWLNSQQQNPQEPVPQFEEHTSFHSNVSDISNPSTYKPFGVIDIISQGHFLIGVLSHTQVLKYPSDPSSTEHQQLMRDEDAILQHIGSQPRIVEYQGLNEYGLMLRYYPYGSLRRLLKWCPNIKISRKLEWCGQLTTAIQTIHSKNVIHCDICLHNVLLDENIEAVLADFQGILLSQNNQVLVDGRTRECPKSYMPREDVEYASFKTDLFALGSAIYHIINGHEVFPELRNLHDHVEILRRFTNRIYPGSNYVASHIVEKCWRGEYANAGEVVNDLAEVLHAARQVEAQNSFFDSGGV